MHRIWASFISLVFLVVFVLPITLVFAYTDEADIAECQRLDIINGCNCKCNDANLQQVCQKNVSGVGECVNRAAPLVKSSTTTSLGIRPFPTVGNSGGVLIVDADGNILLGATGVNIFKWVFWLLGAGALILGVYGGFLYTTARADDDQVEKAVKVMKNALLGFLIALAGLLIVLLLARVFRFYEDPAAIDQKVANEKTAAEKARERQEEKNLFDKIFK